MGACGLRYVPATLPLGKTRYPLHRRLGGPQGPSGRVRKNSPPPGLDPRTVHPVASRYMDYAIPTRNVSSYVYVCMCGYIYIFKVIFS